ncbi:MAG: transcriptional regulator, TetR family [Phormidesmis priestleyi Ana]|uniref:Transcriptional regulator, TetR family n=1 Tax=Phormidesmis priestleyi Ana TaxID=1666911 RepID=A0A0P7Z0Z6_9CYAN|nr:MAG: transcriptional regulator, TetR family [Phormidesmis priestleyi Ana]
MSSRERIVGSALSLFAQQGITATTTKQIAEQADVNEVTLFRQFGSKQGLLLAVLKEAPILEKMQVALASISGANDPLAAYGASGLDLLGRVPELVRSLIGEAGQSPPENLQALGQAARQANQQTVAYLLGAQIQFSPGLSVEAAASLLNTLILGRAVIESTSQGNQDSGLWQSREDFLAAGNALFLAAEEGLAAPNTSEHQDKTAVVVADLPVDMVRSLFQKARRLGAQEYALVYVLFGAGLRVNEVAGLLRSQSLSSKNQHLLTITGASPRQVPLNRWILGNRYGTYSKNPLTQWLKSRQDDQLAVFIDPAGQPLGEAGIIALWKAITAENEAEIITYIGSPATPFHARQTWCIELLIKGISLEHLSILSGMSLPELDAYARRAKEKAALEQALAIDQKNT